MGTFSLKFSDSNSVPKKIFFVFGFPSNYAHVCIYPVVGEKQRE